MKAKITVENELQEDETEAMLREIESLEDKKIGEKASEPDYSIAAGDRVKRKRIEAALFIANRPLGYTEIATIIKLPVKEVMQLVQELIKEYAGKKGAIEIMLQNDEVIMQVRNEYLGDVSTLSKETELTKKGLKMLGLIVKKKQMLQSELKYYFKGEIYAYVTELKKLGYITSEKYKNTRLLKPTKKFAESFQLPVQQ